MSRFTVIAQTVKERAFTIALWTGLLAAAWSLPVLDRIKAHEEHQRMESGYYYKPQRPPAAYMDNDAAAQPE